MGSSAGNPDPPGSVEAYARGLEKGGCGRGRMRYGREFGE